jgi:hypothetical protein
VNDCDNAVIEGTCRELAQGFQGLLSWKWDRRFETVLGEFSVEKQEVVRQTLERHLRLTWDSSNVGHAPQVIRAIDDRFGGLRPGQIIFTSDPAGDALIFCTWWPWSDGKEISIRIGVAFKTREDSESVERLESFKNWFAV